MVTRRLFVKSSAMAMLSTALVSRKRDLAKNRRAWAMACGRVLEPFAVTPPCESRAWATKRASGVKVAAKAGASLLFQAASCRVRKARMAGSVSPAPAACAAPAVSSTTSKASPRTAAISARPRSPRATA